MLIQKEVSHNKVTIKGYSPGVISMQSEDYRSPIVLTSETISRFENDIEFNQLSAEVLLNLVAEDTEILIIGSGAKHQLLPVEKVKALNDRGYAVESMSTRNACHTFQVLVHEYRKVVALLFP
ncbi:hypothetical protein FLL45_02160 [Aliikangiella marina]|uniref:Xcc1710-like domain-containing protein n=1 Tax=Aliikangiella marina TaxID=1712262 RepID=A0A545THU4_9GAMM|nr:Mth938-like domain-containing protein [Aliikangiella marina]TQV76782.1 hypothetical protein FLL45_02160 [Aliikangiella marina]